MKPKCTSQLPSTRSVGAHRLALLVGLTLWFVSQLAWAGPTPHQHEDAAELKGEALLSLAKATASSLQLPPTLDAWTKDVKRHKAQWV